MAGKRLTKDSTQYEERSDKKRQVAPTVRDEIYEYISQILLICDNSIRPNNFRNRLGCKTIGEALILRAMRSRDVLYKLSMKYHREIMIGNTLYRGDSKRPKNKPPVFENGEGLRLPMRFTSLQYDKIALISYALGCPVGTAVGMILDEAVRSQEVVLSVVAQLARTHIDDDRKKQLLRLLRAINANLEGIERVSLAMLIKLITETAIVGARTIQSVLMEYLGERR